jgi:hypothetical protein
MRNDAGSVFRIFIDQGSDIADVLVVQERTYFQGIFCADQRFKPVEQGGRKLISIFQYWTQQWGCHKTYL